MIDEDRYLKAKELRDSGMTFAQVGRELGVTGGRAGQMYHTAQRILRQKSERRPVRWHDELPTGTINSLKAGLPSIDVDDVEQFRDALNNGLDLEKIPNLGNKGIALIYKVLSIEYSEEPQLFSEGHAKACISYLEKWGYKVIPPDK